MATIQNEIQFSVDELVQAAEQLSTPDLEELVSRMLRIRAKRRAPSLSSKETELLQGINKGLPSEVWSRYRELRAKLEAETLTPEEHNELLDLSHQREHLEVRRLELLADLADLRDTTIEALIEELGLRTRNDG